MNPILTRLLGAAAATGRGASRGGRYMAKVPQGQNFFSSPAQSVLRLMRLGFNPNLGRWGNWGKRGLFGLMGYNAVQGARGASSEVSQLARQAAQVAPSQDYREVAGTIADAPLTSMLSSFVDRKWSRRFPQIEEDTRAQAARWTRGSTWEAARGKLRDASEYSAKPLQVLKDIASPLRRPALKLLPESENARSNFQNDPTRGRD